MSNIGTYKKALEFLLTYDNSDVSLFAKRFIQNTLNSGTDSTTPYHGNGADSDPDYSQYNEPSHWQR